MLEVADLARRYGDVVALDGLRSRSSRGSCSGSSAPTAPARRRRCGSSSACSSPTRARCAGAASRSTWRRGRASATCRRSAGCTRRCGCATSSPTSPRCTGSAGRGAARRPTWLERLGIAERAGDRVETLSLGNQQRVQLGGRARARAGAARARRAVLGARPGRRRRAQRRAARSSPTRACRCCSPRTSSSSWSGCASRWRSSRTGGWWRPAGSTTCARAGAAPTVRVAVRGGGRGVAGGRAGRRGGRPRADGVLVALRDGRGPEAVLDAARGDRHGHALRARAPDADRAVPQGGGGVSGLRGRAGRRAGRAARGDAEAAREVVPDLDGRDLDDHRARRGASRRCSARAGRRSSRSAAADAELRGDRARRPSAAGASTPR